MSINKLNSCENNCNKIVVHVRYNNSVIVIDKNKCRLLLNNIHSLSHENIEYDTTDIIDFLKIEFGNKNCGNFSIFKCGCAIKLTKNSASFISKGKIKFLKLKNNL